MGSPGGPGRARPGIYALIDAREGKSRRSALFLGAGLASQPLVILVVPLAVARVPRRRWAQYVNLTITVPALLLVAPLVRAWSTTLHTFVAQPTSPGANHPTPWMALSPVLSRSPRFHPALHSSVNVLSRSAAHAGEVVAGGPLRLVPIVLAVSAGVYVSRHRPTEPQLWWFVAALLASRCLFEAVMTPYYAVPALALALVVAGGSTRWSLAAAVGCAAACTYLGYLHARPWVYYPPVVATLVLAVVAAYVPRSLARRRNARPHSDRGSDRGSAAPASADPALA